MATDLSVQDVLEQERQDAGAFRSEPWINGKWMLLGGGVLIVVVLALWLRAKHPQSQPGASAGTGAAVAPLARTVVVNQYFLAARGQYQNPGVAQQTGGTVTSPAAGTSMEPTTPVSSSTGESSPASFAGGSVPTGQQLQNDATAYLAVAEGQASTLPTTQEQQQALTTDKTLISQDIAQASHYAQLYNQGVKTVTIHSQSPTGTPETFQASTQFLANPQHTLQEAYGESLSGSISPTRAASLYQQGALAGPGFTIKNPATGQTTWVQNVHQIPAGWDIVG